MLHEARDRQKFVSDVLYLRDLQHKVDSEYQACLRRQEYRRDPNEKTRDHFGGQETNFERARSSSRSFPKQSSNEEDPLAEPRLSTKNSGVKCDSRLPAIDQTSVRQKHKSTMTTTRTPERVGPSKPSPAGAPQVLPRRRRPNLGRMTVSPDAHFPRASGDRSRQKPRLPAAPGGAGPVVQQEGPMRANDTKPKRPTHERRNLVPTSQLMTMTKNSPERAKKGDPSALSPNEPHPALSQVFQRTSNPQVLSPSLGPPLITPTGGPKRVPFRFRDEDFYSVLSLSPGEDDDDTEEETHVEEELLLANMHPPRSPSNRKRSRFLGASATQANNKNPEDKPENGRATSVRRSEASHGPLRRSNVTEPVTEQPPVRLRMFQDPRLPDKSSVKESNSGDSENEEKTFHSWDTKSKSSLDDDLSADNVFSDCASVGEDRPGTRDYERGWQTYLNHSSASLDYFLSGRPTAPRLSVNSSYNTPGSCMHAAPRGDMPVALSMTSALVHSSGSAENSRFNVRRPLSPIRNRTPTASAENHSYFPVNSAHEFDVRGADTIPLTSQPRGAPLYTADLSLHPHSSLSLVGASSSCPSRANVQGQWCGPVSLQENTPLTLYAVSDFPNQKGNGNSMATNIKADPERLKKLQESLLEDDSEEEGDVCRICQIARASPADPLLQPCGCVGSLKFVHQECLKKWLKVKITSGADLGTVKTCEMCKQGLLVNLGDLNLTEFYRKHQQSRVQNELMNSGLYLVLLFHLYKQRFEELLRLSYNRVARQSLSRHFPQPRPEENENAELGDGNESSIYQSNSRVL